MFTSTINKYVYFSIIFFLYFRLSNLIDIFVKKNLIENFYRLENNTVEAIEILVNSDSKINNILFLIP